MNTFLAITICAIYGFIVGLLCVGPILWAMHCEDELKEKRRNDNTK
ncbi:hypothetical protein SEA_GIBBLES_67 [Gordonia phage Gibbles]|nr:hypothetical protein SEA_ROBINSPARKLES_71 [Gordonia phage RobinSparkles]QDK02026.1 hypothetical protein SEA_GIBBLES_67 [Gordonia phage Gibbles]